MAELVYVLCGATSLACAVLLLRTYARTGVRLLLWSGLCFVGLAADNLVLTVDMIVLPEVSLSLWRKIPVLTGLLLLLYGLVWETR